MVYNLKEKIESDSKLAEFIDFLNELRDHFNVFPLKGKDYRINISYDEFKGEDFKVNFYFNIESHLQPKLIGVFLSKKGGVYDIPQDYKFLILYNISIWLGDDQSILTLYKRKNILYKIKKI